MPLLASNSFKKVTEAIKRRRGNKNKFCVTFKMYASSFIPLLLSFHFHFKNYFSSLWADFCFTLPSAINQIFVIHAPLINIAYI